MDELLFQKDQYARSCNSDVVSVLAGGVVLRQSVFFARAGGQQGDQGVLEQGVLEQGVLKKASASKQLRVQDCIYQTEDGEDKKVIVHLIDENDQQEGKLSVGDVVEARIDWQRRYAMMRLHTALHLLCSLVPHGVTGGNIAPDKARLDFDCGGEDLQREELQEKLNRLIADDRAITSRWVDEEVLRQDPGLVRTLSVQPPRTGGKVRLIDIEDCDLQPCGGTHVKSTAELGAIVVGKIENKGRHNRRISLRLAQEGKTQAGEIQEGKP